MLSSVICLFPNKEKSKLLDWKKGLVLRPILHGTFVSWSMLSDWFAISLASSWGTGNFACTLVKFLPISPVEPGYLLSIPSHSSSLHISRLQHIWSLLLSLLILLFPTPFLPRSFSTLLSPRKTCWLLREGVPHYRLPTSLHSSNLEISYTYSNETVCWH